MDEWNVSLQRPSIDQEHHQISLMSGDHKSGPQFTELPKRCQLFISQSSHAQDVAAPGRPATPHVLVKDTENVYVESRGPDGLAPDGPSVDRRQPLGSPFTSHVESRRPDGRAPDGHPGDFRQTLGSMAGRADITAQTQAARMTSLFVNGRSLVTTMSSLCSGIKVGTPEEYRNLPRLRQDTTSDDLLSWMTAHETIIPACLRVGLHA